VEQPSGPNCAERARTESNCMVMTCAESISAGQPCSQMTAAGCAGPRERALGDDIDAESDNTDYVLRGGSGPSACWKIKQSKPQRHVGSCSTGDHCRSGPKPAFWHPAGQRQCAKFFAPTGQRLIRLAEAHCGINPAAAVSRPARCWSAQSAPIGGHPYKITINDARAAGLIAYWGLACDWSIVHRSLVAVVRSRIPTWKLPGFARVP